MRIIKPCDWEVIDLLFEPDANKFGEALRHYCFVGNSQQVGCYSTFDLIECLEEVKSGKIYEEAKAILNPDDELGLKVFHYQIKEEDCWVEHSSWSNENEVERSKICEPYEIVVAWLWDGDGHLYFRFNDRKVENTDCKCDYYWKWID